MIGSGYAWTYVQLDIGVLRAQRAIVRLRVRCLRADGDEFGS